MNGEARCSLYRPHMPTLRQEFRSEELVRVQESTEEPARQSVVGERRDNESRESTANSRAPTKIVDGQGSRQKE
jgi:hypothetical protein